MDHVHLHCNLALRNHQLGYFHCYNNHNNRLTQEFPEIEALLEELSHYLNDEIIRNLNYQVDENRKTPSEVAKNFLLENNLIEEK